MPMLKKTDKKKRQNANDLSTPHTIPGPVPISVLQRVVINSNAQEEQKIRDYVECEGSNEKVVFLEKVTTENLFDRKLDAWDVRTNRNRYWVITSPTNLYSQKLFPSLDYTLSFHVGISTRLLAQHKATATDQQQDRLAAVWRRWIEAAEALDRADEAEEFQSVGMLCRECLIALIRVVANKKMVPDGQPSPKASDFIHWTELIANTIARGDSVDEIRTYLKTISKATWQLVSWLTHASNAVRFDGHMAIDATEVVITAFGTALVRYETGTPDKCPSCSSYRIGSVYRPDLSPDSPYVPMCESCGWGETEKHGS
jgi:hypothetical protein